MKMKLVAILALAVILLWPLQGQSQQNIRHFGYFGPSTDTDLSKVRSYTDFTYVDGVYGQSISSLATRVRNNGVRSVIDLGKVLWCPSPGNDLWHLCGINGEVDYVTRWNDWRAMNRLVLNSNLVLAFSVITEHTKREIPTVDVEKAVDLVQGACLDIPTLVSVGQVDIERSDFDLPHNADWIGFAAYYTHPNLDWQVAQDIRTLKSKKQSWQRIAYGLDGFFTQNHINAGLTLDNMDTIAQEWYTLASRDPEAILLAVFAWFPVDGGYGSVDFPNYAAQHVLDKHAAIGAAILSGRGPTYQGNFDTIDCQSVAGWAWDTSQPNTPISVDIYDGQQKIGTVRADQYRQDLVNAGIGNGKHGWTFTLPPSVRNGQNHWIGARYSGLSNELNSSPRYLNCAAPPVYEGYLEAADCNSIVGWAADRSRLNTSIGVGIYDSTNSTNPVSTVLAGDLRSDVGVYLGDNGRHGFAIPTPPQFKDGLPHTLRVKFETSATELNGSPRTITCTTGASASIAWIQPAETSWGPANTMTVAGYAQNGSGGVQLVWRDATINGPWNVVSWQPPPGADNTWSNTIPSPYRCHNFQAYVNYSGVQSSFFSYNGLTAGYCNESARVIWIQPQSTAGFGPPGSLVIAGSATNAPSGTQVYLWYRNVSLGTGWTRLDFAPPPGSDGIWYNSIPNANPFHQYQVYVAYDAITSSPCTYSGNNSPTSCP